jgi:hypothetical protein
MIYDCSDFTDEHGSYQTTSSCESSTRSADYDDLACSFAGLSYGNGKCLSGGDAKID